jgi:hypothetical protein
MPILPAMALAALPAVLLLFRDMQRSLSIWTVRLVVAPGLWLWTPRLSARVMSELGLGVGRFSDRSDEHAQHGGAEHGERASSRQNSGGGKEARKAVEAFVVHWISSRCGIWSRLICRLADRGQSAVSRADQPAGGGPVPPWAIERTTEPAQERVGPLFHRGICCSEVTCLFHLGFP